MVFWKEFESAAVDIQTGYHLQTFSTGIKFSPLFILIIHNLKREHSMDIMQQFWCLTYAAF